MTCTSELVDTQQALSRLLGRCSSATAVGFDTESAGPLAIYGKKMLNLHRSTMVGFSLAFPDGACFYVPTGHGSRRLTTRAAQQVFDALPRNAVVWAHNWKWDYMVLTREGVSLKQDGSYLCSMVASYDADIGVQRGSKKSYGLKGLTAHHFGSAMVTYGDAVNYRGGLLCIPPKLFMHYPCADAYATLRLGEMARAAMHPENWAYFNRVTSKMPFVLGRMELRGLCIDERQIHETYNTVSPIEQRCRLSFAEEFNGVSISSTHQLKAVLCGLGYTGGGTTHEELEESVASANPKLAAALERVLEWRSVASIVNNSTYKLLDRAWDNQDGKLHTNWNQIGTATGRLSSSNPNLQNLAARGPYASMVRKAIVPAPGHVFVAADQSQIELRVLAHYIGGSLAEAYKSGVTDIHQERADSLGISRSAAKAINFAVPYGTGAFTLSKRIGCSVDEANEFLAAYFRGSPEILSLRNMVWRRAKETGWMKLATGVRRPVSSGTASERRASFNKLFQGSTAELMNQASIEIDKDLGSMGALVAQEHDSLCVEAVCDKEREVSELIKYHMENTVKLNVPLLAEPKSGMNLAQVK